MSKINYQTMLAQLKRRYSFATQSWIAEQVGCSQGTISAIESGLIEPGLHIINGGVVSPIGDAIVRLCRLGGINAAIEAISS